MLIKENAEWDKIENVNQEQKIEKVEQIVEKEGNNIVKICLKILRLLKGFKSQSLINV